LATYVTPDGRVIRRDQGGDIVSEGQAYGMLIAELAGRSATVRTIWSWTSAHLARPDGLLQYHASGSGQVESNQPAADADALAAYALLRYRGGHAAALHKAGLRIAQSILTAESTTVDGVTVPVAGPWALATTPPTVNPSYWMPSVFAALAHYTGDGRWRAAASATVGMVADATDVGRSLPTDWARLADGRLVPIAQPGGGAPVQYGLDAARLPLWFGTSCDAKATQVAARWWTNRLRTGNRAADLALSPTGTPIDQQTNPLPLLAAAAAAAAAGDRVASRTLRGKAARQARRVPTYYGDAWLAIGGALLDGTLNPCREAAGG
jgi:endoglucanase